MSDSAERRKHLPFLIHEVGVGKSDDSSGGQPGD